MKMYLYNFNKRFENKRQKFDEAKEGSYLLLFSRSL